MSVETDVSAPGLGDLREEWDSDGVISGLLDEGRLMPDTDGIVRYLGERLLSAGAPVWRIRLSMRTLHPLVVAVSSIWKRDEAEVESLGAAHGLEGRAGYLGSPLEIISRTLKPFRKRLGHGLGPDDHNALHELAERGATDYYGTHLKFSRGRGAILVFVTDASEGFSDHDIACLEEIATVLAPIAEVQNLKLISRAVAEAYLGPRTGPRVLEGKITRGDVETVEAAVLVSDLRDWTGLNSRLGPEAAMAHANRYFEIMAQAVETNGGEILKLIGDGVLAIFPVDGDATGSTACQNALSAARSAFELARTADMPDPLAFGVGLHYGEVLYGNVGSQSRLDFTVMGPAVNIAARIEGLCNELNQPLLMADAVRKRVGLDVSPAATKQLKGTDHPTEIFALRPD